MKEQNQNRWGKYNFTLLNTSMQFAFLIPIHHDYFSLCWKAWISADGRLKWRTLFLVSSCWKRVMSSCLRGKLPHLAYTQGLFWYPCWAASWLTKVHTNLRSPCNKIQVDLAEFCILAFKWWKGTDFFLDVVNWTVLGFCKMLKKSLLVVSDIKIFFFPSKAGQEINVRTYYNF